LAIDYPSTLLPSASLGTGRTGCEVYLAGGIFYKKLEKSVAVVVTKAIIYE
jgi:hypothetical protein